MGFTLLFLSMERTEVYRKCWDFIYMLSSWWCAGIPTSLIKASPTICLVRSENESTIQLTPLSFLSLLPLPREKKCICSTGDLFTPRPNSHLFSLLSLHQIICYGFSVMKIFGSSLRSLNISFSLKIKIMPQLDGDNVANTLEAIVASRVEPSHMYVWHLICALELPQSCLLWSELFQWCLKINWIFKNVSFSYRSWWPNGWGGSGNGIYCHLQYHLTLFDSFHQS